jgi:hypothetical protein
LVIARIETAFFGGRLKPMISNAPTGIAWLSPMSELLGTG